MRIVTPIVFIAGLLSGCTSLQTMPDNFRTERRDFALQGFPYALPMRQFEMEASWTLSDCDTRVLGPMEKVPPKTTITPSLEITPLMAPGERYLVDYLALGNAFKTTDFAIETYPEGTLKSINAVAEDRSGEVLVAAAKIAGTIAGGGLQPLSSTNFLKMNEGQEGVTSQSYQVACMQTTLDLLKEVAGKKGAVKAATAHLKDVTAQVEQLALAGMVDSTARTALAASLANLRKANGDVDAAKSELADAQKPLRITRKLRWPEDFSVGGKDPVAIAGQTTPAFDGLFEGKPADDNTRPSQKCTRLSKPGGDWKACLTDELVIHVRLEPAFDLASDCDFSTGNMQPFACKAVNPEQIRNPGQEYSPQEWARYIGDKAIVKANSSVPGRNSVPDKGLFVRPPESGRLVACHHNPTCAPTPEDSIKVSDWMAVPQLGQLRFLPFENGMFENNALVLALSKDGTINKFQFASKAAVAERLATAASDALTGAKKSWRDERAARRADQLADLDHQIALDEKTDKVAALSSPPAAEPVEEEADQAQRIALKLEIEIEDRLVEAATSD